MLKDTSAALHIIYDSIEIFLMCLKTLGLFFGWCSSDVRGQSGSLLLVFT